MSEAVIELRDVVRRYPGVPPVESLREVTLRVEPGELLAVMGPSGSGKTTLLHIAGTLDRPTSGSVRIDGVDTSGMSDRQLSGCGNSYPSEHDPPVPKSGRDPLRNGGANETADTTQAEDYPDLRAWNMEHPRHVEHIDGHQDVIEEIEGQLASRDAVKQS